MTARADRPAPTVRLPSRRYHLLLGPIDGMTESLALAPSWQTANLAWPDDRSWFVATEIDFAWTYLAGSPTLIDEVAGHPDLEVMRARIDHEVTLEAERINPLPPRSVTF